MTDETSETPFNEPSSSRKPFKEPWLDVMEFLASRDSQDLAEWMQEGFRYWAAHKLSDTLDDNPFGLIRIAYPRAGSISDELATAYHDYRKACPETGAKNPFTLALVATFNSLSLHDETDRKALVEVVRLIAKTGYARALDSIVTRLFPGDGDESVERLRSVALDVAIELSARAADPVPRLQGIVRSGVFRKSASRTILLALCAHDQLDLFNHLELLEDGLVQAYADRGPVEQELLWKGRSLLLYDMLKATSPNVVLGVIRFALEYPQWPLSWLADIVHQNQYFEALPEGISWDLLKLRDDIGRLVPIPAKPSAALLERLDYRYSIADRQSATYVLSSLDALVEEEFEVVFGLIRHLTGAGTDSLATKNKMSGSLAEEHLLREDMFLAEAELRDAA
jgi:hypothetical protein